MASNYTSNYNLCQWAEGDKVLRTDFNADNAKIDAAIAAVDRRVDGKASASALSGLQSAVAGHTSALARAGNCQLYLSSYEGDGTFGSGSPRSITFPHKPAGVIVYASGVFLVMLRGQTVAKSTAYSSNEATCQVAWEGNTIRWFHSSLAQAQMNAARNTYFVLALLEL